MKLAEAINASQILAARGYDTGGRCVVSVAYYGGQHVWMEGWGGNWTNEWKPIPETEMSKLDELDFRPTGSPPPADLVVMREIFEHLEDEDNDVSPHGE